MPKLPTADDLAYVAPRPGRGVTEFRAPNIQPDVYTGKVLSEIGAMMQKESEEMSDLQAQDALNKLREQRTTLTYDPEKGFMGVKGGAVIDRKVLETFPQQFDQQIEGLAAGIGSAKAQAKFRAAAAHEKAAFSGDVARHSLREVDTYHANVFNAQVQNAARTASTDLTKAESSLAEVNAAADKELLRRGYGTETPENKVVRDAFRAESLDVVHAAVLSKMIEDDQIGDASTYMKLKGASMSAKTRQHFAPMLKSLTDFDTARNLANEARQQALAGKAPEEIENYLEQKSTNPRMLQEARAMFEQKEKAAFEDSGRYMLRVLKDPSRRNLALLTGEVEADTTLSVNSRARIMQTMVAEVQRREDHARMLSEHAENKAFRDEQRAYMLEERRLRTDPVALTTYGALSDRIQNEGPIPPEAVAAYLGTIGAHGVAQLLALQARQATAAGKWHLDPKLVDGAMPAALLAPANKALRDAFRSAVVEAVDAWKVANPERIPNEAEQRTLLDAGARTYVDIAPGWFGRITGARQRPAYEVTQAERQGGGDFMPKADIEFLTGANGGQAYVPAGDITSYKPMPSWFVEERSRHLRSMGATNISREQLLRDWVNTKHSRKDK